MAALVGDLPPGEGRVPEWWMDCTPHYILDLDEEAARRQFEEQMTTYFNQLGEHHDMETIFDAEGNLKLGPDGTPVAFQNNWHGRTTAGGGSSNGDDAGGPGGRNFKIDPNLLHSFGVTESDPDYKSYLTGAKLPPGFVEKLRMMYGQDGILNNSHQTDYGRYGRQAEKPTFKPNWAGKKLRSTAAGQHIRQGQYDDSPNKHYHRRMQQQQQQDGDYNSDLNSSYASLKSASPPPTPSKNSPVRAVEPAVPAAVPVPVQTPDLVEIVEPEPEPAPEPAPEPYQETAVISTQSEVFVHDEHEHLAEPEADIEEEEEEILEEEYEEEEVIEEEYEDEEYEEEEDDDDDGDDLEDLQAILAAKQAELLRLQQQL